MWFGSIYVYGFPETAVVVSIIIYLLNFPTAEGILCYQCKGLPHPRDCNKIIECGEHEECVVMKYVTPDGHIFFSSGCESSHVCRLLDQKKRQFDNDVEICRGCCNTDYCNKEVCDTKLPDVSTMLRCLQCGSVNSPTDCRHVTGCLVDEKCFTKQAISEYGEIRYSMGCEKETTCRIQQQQQQNSIVGREIQFCQDCCDTENCNRDLCLADNSTSITPPVQQINSTDVTATCYDAAGVRCQDFTLLLSVCVDVAEAYKMCAKTCKLCT